MIKSKGAQLGQLKSFGMAMGIVFMIIGSVLFFKHKNYMLYVIISAIFFVTGLVIPGWLKPLYVFWMKLALVLSWINTRLILFLLFYIIFTPIGLVIKLLHRDLLDRRIDKKVNTYWKQKEKKTFGSASYERQF